MRVMVQRTPPESIVVCDDCRVKRADIFVVEEFNKVNQSLPSMKISAFCNNCFFDEKSKSKETPELIQQQYQADYS